MGPKIVKRMQNDRFRNTTYGKLESAVGRLVHASSVLGEPIANYHFTLKLVRRRINALNNNPSLLDRTAYLPPYVTIELTRWKHILTSNRFGRRAEKIRRFNQPLFINYENLRK